MLTCCGVRFFEADEPDGDPPRRRGGGLEARLADALVDRLMETRLAEALLDRVLQSLQGNPAVDALVDRQVGRVLQALAKCDALRQLVREQADAYLKHLNEHPEQVRELVQDQSLGMVREFQETVRGAALDGDDAVESWVRRVLGRS